MRTSFTLIVATACLCFFTSCRQYRYVYSASKPNTPILKKKGDARLSVSYSGGNAHGFGDSSRNHGFDFQSAYAITNHFAVMASHAIRTESDLFLDTRDIFKDSYVTYKRHSTEVGGGVFTRPESSFILSVYSGYGFGGFRINDMGVKDSFAYHRYFKTNLGRFFFQPGISVVSGNLSFDWSLRFSYFNFSNTATDYSNNESEYLNLQRPGSRSFQLFESAFTFQLPLPELDWLQLESTLSFASRRTNFNVRGLTISIGLNSNPSKWWKQKKQ